MIAGNCGTRMSPDQTNETLIILLTKATKDLFKYPKAQFNRPALPSISFL